MRYDSKERFNFNTSNNQGNHSIYGHRTSLNTSGPSQNKVISMRHPARRQGAERDVEPEGADGVALGRVGRDGPGV